MVRSLRAKEMGPCTRMQFKAGPRPRRQACSRVDLLLKGNGAVRAGGARVIHRARPTGILVLNEMPATAGLVAHETVEASARPADFAISVQLSPPWRAVLSFDASGSFSAVAKLPGGRQRRRRILRRNDLSGHNRLAAVLAYYSGFCDGRLPPQQFPLA